MTKTEALEKMNRRHGTDVADYYMMLVWLKRSAERCERKGPTYAEQAAWYQADHAEMMGAV